MTPGLSPTERLAQTRTSLDRHRDYLALLQAVANESSQLDSVLAEVIEMTCESLGWPIGHAMCVGEDGKPKVGHADAWYVRDPESLAPFRAATESFEELGVLNEAIESGQPTRHSNLANNPEFRRRKIAAQLGLDHLFTAPIRSRDRVVAIIEFLTPTIDVDKLESVQMLLGSICSTVGRVAEREETERQRSKLLRSEFRVELAELHAAELERLTAELRRRNAELDQFAYVASHDLRAPLRGIANLASWLAKDLEPHLTDDTRRYLELLGGRVQRMEGLINGLLEYSRAGRRRVPVETVDAGELIREIIDTLGADGEVEWVVGELPQLHTRRLLLLQVLQNLMSNALKYAEADPLRVEIGAQPATLGAGVEGWRFFVRDNGRGIDPRYHDRVWQIFQTLQPRDHVEGTGIGLSLVRKIVEQQGGRVELESAPDQGATFSFTWPAQIHD